MSQKQIQVKFAGHEINNGVVKYKIQLYDPKDSSQWVLWHRYSTMRDVAKQLSDEFPDRLPEFPPKKWFGNTDEKFINQREKALENFFSTTLKNISIDKAKCLRDFLMKGKEGSQLVQEVPGKSEINSVVVETNKNNNNNNNSNQPNPSKTENNNTKPNPDSALTTQQKLEQKKNTSQEEWKRKMEAIVSKVPFINFVPFTSHDHANQDFKRNIYNQIAFETKSALLQTLSLPASTTDHSEAALTAPPASLQIEKKLDVLAEKIAKALSQPLSNISCEIAQRPNFA